MRDKLTIILGLGVNLVSAIAIVFLNKLIYVRYQFPSMSLTLVHFLVTSAILHLCAWRKVFLPKKLELLRVAPLSAAFCGFVVLTNLSLQFNTVGTYQLTKAMTTPVILLLQSAFYGKQSSTNVKLTVIPVLFGVFLNSYYDVHFNVPGSVFAVMGVLVTSVYQIWVGSKQSEFEVNSMQLLYYQAPLSSAMLCGFVPFFEPVLTTALSLPIDGILLIALTGLIALMVNLSIFWVIGKTSPITYNMMGHLKFSVTLLGGYCLFNESVSSSQLLGIASTVSGISLYTYFKLSEQAREQKRTRVRKLITA